MGRQRRKNEFFFLNLNLNRPKRETRVKNRAINILFAGGGTGGHLFPGIAVADAFMARNPDNRVLFVGTGKPLELSVVSKSGFRHATISARGMKGLGMKNQALAMVTMPLALFQSLRILKSFSPDLVFGLGGYSSWPVAVGAWILGIRIALHEQNIFPGITNRILSFLADRIFVSFSNGRFSRAVARKIRFAGNPVRKEIAVCAKHAKSKETGRFTTLILGGSQGAHALNLAVVASLECLKKKATLRFIHQTGAADFEMVKTAYDRERETESTVAPFFDDMANLYRNADLIICRAGATTIAEVMATGKPAIFVPYPFAANNHQELNANFLSNQGAAETIRQKNLTGNLLAEKIEYYASNPAFLEEMGKTALKNARPNAAGDIVIACYKML